MLRVILLALLSLVLCACNQATSPVDPKTEAKWPSASELLSGNYDPLDDFFREGAGIIEGDVTLNGATETDPTYDTSPYVVTQPAKDGDIAIYRIRGKLTNNATTTLYTKQSSPSKNYSSFSVPGTNVDQYKAMYVTGTEPLNLTFYNSTSFNTPLNGPAAIYDYNYKTTPADNAGEPNDDENSATITDRTLANNLPQGFVATRSVYSFDATKKDLEEWYKVTVAEGDRFSFKFTTVQNRFGTWGFTMKVFDPTGVQMGGTTTISIGEGAAGITRTAIQSGTHYLQLVGTPSTKNNTNVFFNLYTITACVAAKVNSTSLNPNLSTCPGATQQWTASLSSTADTYQWTFGGGCIPDFSTSASPSVTLGAPGTYNARLTVTNSCNFTEFDFPYTIGCGGWAGTQGGATGGFTTLKIVVDPDGSSHILGTFTGTVDLDPSAAENIQTTTVSKLFVAQLDDLGRLQALSMVGGSASTFMDAQAMTYDSVRGYRVTGRYLGAVDFNPDAGTASRTSTIDGEVFLLALDPNLGFLWVNAFALDGEGEAVALIPGTSQTVVMGTFLGSVDFDPGFSTFVKSAGTGKDAYCMLYDNATGRFTNGVTWGNTGTLVVTCASTNGGVLDIGGVFSGVIDMDPSGSTFSLNGGASNSTFLTRFSPTNELLFMRANSFVGSASVLPEAVVTTATGASRTTGSFQGTTNFDSGGTQNRTSLGQADTYVCALSNTGVFEWVYTLGGVTTDLGLSITVVPATNELRVGGCWSGTVDFDPGVGQDVRVATSSLDGFLLSLTNTGTRTFVSTWSGTGAFVPASVGVDQNASTTIYGTFAGQVDFDPGVGTFVVPAAGSTDAFVQKVLANGTWTP